MLQIAITVDNSQLKRALAELGKKAPTAIMRALNRTADSVKTQAVRAVVADLALSRQKRVRENIKVEKATPHQLSAAVRAVPGGAGVVAARGKSEKRGRIPLLEFHARGRYPSRGRGAGVTYRLRGGRGIAPHAFIAVMQSGHKGVFQRIPGTQMERGRGRASSRRRRQLWKREKIAELFGPSIPRVFTRKRVLSVLTAKGRAELKKNLEQQITHLLRARISRRG